MPSGLENKHQKFAMNLGGAAIAVAVLGVFGQPMLQRMNEEYTLIAGALFAGGVMFNYRYEVLGQRRRSIYRMSALMLFSGLAVLLFATWSMHQANEKRYGVCEQIEHRMIDQFKGDMANIYTALKC